MAAGSAEPVSALFNASLLPLVVAHEGVPGHLLQLSLSRKATTSIRKAFLSRGFAEGWAHYVESMILDQGYSSDPKLRLFATQSVLSRLARLLLVIKLHTEGMSLDQGAAFYEQLAFVSPAQARQETRRATYELGLMSYAIGRMQILKLLAEEKTRRGAAFSLREFHDRLISYGTLPVSVVGRLMRAGR
jgi:uncharacterized protein (DUF885 family)